MESTEDSAPIALENISESTSEEVLFIPSALDTMENFPSTKFYRQQGLKRATASYIRAGRHDEESMEYAEPTKIGHNFNTFSGVFLRCVSNIMSVVYYLRVGWVTGQCGLGLSLVMIVVCTLATLLTALSMSVLATNGMVKGGGVYYFISRSLGADYGGTIGVIFGFATTFSTVLHVFGFVEVVQGLIGHDISKDGKYDIPIIGISMITILMITICISLKWEFILQYTMILLMGLSVIFVLFGFIVPGRPQWKLENLRNNLEPCWSDGETFWSVFAVFFPACTGIMAGANISGDLKDPQRSIPIGTIGAVLFTSSIYAVTMIAVAACADRKTLLYDGNIMEDMSIWKWIVTIGVLAASISSASSQLVGGPKIYQALFKDDICPKFFKFFAWGKKGTGDPLVMVVVGWVLVVICTFIFKDLNAVGTFMTLFFLISYAIIHISALVARMSRSPSWRPAWRYFHPITAVIGAALLIASMFLINWVSALVVVAVTALFFMYFHWSDRSLNNWGEFPQSLLFTNTVGNLQKLKEVKAHVKTYRPQIEFLVHYDFNDIDVQFRNVIPFTQMMQQAYSYMSVSALGSEAPETLSEPPNLNVLEKSFYRCWGKVDSSLFSRLLAHVTQYGKLGPNIIAIPYVPAMRNNEKMFYIIGSALDNKMGVTIARGFEMYENEVKSHEPIDVWWLMDDGGLIILFAYLISKHPHWAKCHLRVFAARHKDQNQEVASIQMSKLLKYFRITAEVIVVTLDDPPSQDSLNRWESYNVPNIDELTQHKIPLLLRLRDAIRENSGSSAMIICSMMIPRKNTDPISWLSLIDCISESLPNFLWVHGNNDNVLTFLA